MCTYLSFPSQQHQDSATCTVLVEFRVLRRPHVPHTAVEAMDIATHLNTVGSHEACTFHKSPQALGIPRRLFLVTQRPH